MTRQEFINNITTWWQLISFCSDYDLCACDSVYDDDELDEYINEWLDEHSQDYGWRDLRDLLYDIPTGYEYYAIDSEYGISEIEGLGNYEFSDYKDSALEEMDDGGWWDEDEDEEEPLVYSPPVDTTPVAEEPISFDELVSASQAQISVISDRPKEQPVEVELEAFIGIKATIKGGN